VDFEEKIIGKLNDISKDISDVTVTQAIHGEQLRQCVDHTEDLAVKVSESEKQIDKLNSFRHRFQGVGKFITVCASILAILVALSALL